MRGWISAARQRRPTVIGRDALPRIRGFADGFLGSHQLQVGRAGDGQGGGDGYVAGGEGG